MKNFFPALLALGAVTLSACSTAPAPASLPTESQTVTGSEKAFAGLSDQIVYGTVTNTTNRPYQVSVTPYNQMSGGWCGGTLLSSTWVLTAAHCVEGQSTSSMRVRAGINDLTTSGGQLRTASQIIIHPYYSGAESGYDIALIRVGTAFTMGSTVQTAALPGSGAESVLDVNGKYATVSGWGLTENGTYSNRALREVSIPITPTGSDCGSRPGNTICGKYYQGKDSCNGDSGGPLAARYNSKFYVLGIVSYGPAECRGYGIYTRVNGYINWIYQQTGISAQ
ncbi:serine protease [Deinococcus hopiensis]|uniref:Secreted trypsin-like serine protease n=1 Tax=Deinococcus hopiensis KR-140 TaxID=695939 RepID=A0A1W1VKU8_9DEIO|nr:serine protease [Deinococcus hopiensis]SMB93594.1 Secreted trypsin-like serine protease [Deinococcus hopiensis KR-140]